MTQSGNSGIKAVYNYKKKMLVIQSERKNITENTSSLMQLGRFFNLT